MDQQIMTAETFKRGRSASLWNWLGMRFDHHHQQQRVDRKSTGTKDSCKVKLLPGSSESERMKVADVTPAAVADFHLSCLTLAESPRRWNPKRMRRPVSCYILPVGDGNRSYSETHFPSEPIPQRVRTAGSIQNLVSFDTSIYDQHQNTTTTTTTAGLRSQLSWHWLPGGNQSAEDSGATSGGAAAAANSDAIPVLDDDGDQDDAMTQSCALDRWAESLPHIDSDVSDDDDDGYCCEYESQEYATGLVLPEFTPASGNQTRPGAQPTNIVQPEQTQPTTIKEEEEMPKNLAADAAPMAMNTTAGRLTAELLSVESLNPLVMDCGVYLPGCRHRGRAMVVAELSLLRSHLPPVSHLAQLVTYYQTVPRKSAAKNGLVLLIVGRPDQYSNAFALIEQLLCHFHDRQQKCIDDVIIWSEGGSAPETPLRLSGRSCDVITSIGQLRERLASALSLGCCGGPIAHNQHDWIAFRKIVEPFLSSCRQQSKILYQVISSVRSKMASGSPPLSEPLQIQSALEDLDQLYNSSSCHPDLIGLLAEGPRILQEVSNAKTRLGGDNVDARETMERCSALYAEVQRSVGRLARVCERRKAQLEKHLPSPPPAASNNKEDDDDVDDARIDNGNSVSACRQILSWLCRKGEETLSRYHVTLADSLAAAKSQHREFQRFLILAQKQIVKGKELLEDLQRDSGVATTSASLTPAESRDEQPAVAETDSSVGRTRPSSSNNNSNSSILDLASSLQTQLSKFGHRLDDTRERLEDTSRCYELLDKAYEWGVEAMKLASKLKLDQQPCPPSVASHLLHQVDAFLSSADKVSHPTALEDLNTLARKLDNPKLLDQCKLAQNRCQETMELLEFRRRILTDYVKEDEIKRQEQQQQVQQQQDKHEVESNIYENVAELNASSTCEDKVDGCSNKDFPVWKKNDAGSQSVRAADGNNCVLLRVKKNSSPDASAKQTQQQPSSSLAAYPPHPLRGTTSYSSGTSLSSYASSSTSWSSRMKLAMNRKLSSTGTEPTLPVDDVLDESKMDKNGVNSTGSKTEEEEDHSEDVSVCQSPISVNSHLQCRASSIDLSLPIAEMQESGFTEDNIKSQKTLFLIMREMIQTERDYVRSLEYIIENYIPELSREDIPQALRGKRNVIFGNIEKIYGFHHHYFLRELEHCHNVPFLVGQCFLRHEQHFYLYALYNKNKPKSDALMAEYGTAFFRRKQTELGDKMDLASYLLKPVQRMGKYALLLKQLLKESGDKEPEFVDLLGAEQMVRFQLRHGNDLLAMDSLRDCDINVKEQGRLLRQSEFYCWQGRKKGLRHVFLFEDLILFSKAKRDPERKNLDIYIYKHSMKTSDIGFTAKMGESSTRFEIWFRKRKPNETIVMEATNPDIKQTWVEDISRILWKQALRNRELRMTEMAEMGIGNKPCLDIRPSQDQINDRSISYAQLAKAPKFRHSVCGSILSDSRSSKRPHSIISVSSSASSASSGSGSVNDNRSSNSNGHQDSPASTALVANLHNHRSKTNQSQCSAESGILADLSMSYDDPESGHCRIGRSDSSITTESVDSVTLSPSSPLTSSKSCPYPSMTPISLYVNNKLIPITPSPSHKNMPMTEM